jgi:hypothetical protein
VEPVRTPKAARFGYLNDIAAVNADNVWAVGRLGGPDATGGTLALQFTGGSWHVAGTPNVGAGDNALSGIAAGLNGVMLAVGSSADGEPTRTLIEQYRDQAWTVVSSPNASNQDNSLSAVSRSPDGDVWAVGDSNPHTVGRSLTLHRCA